MSTGEGSSPVEIFLSENETVWCITCYPRYMPPLFNGSPEKSNSSVPCIIANADQKINGGSLGI